MARHCVPRWKAEEEGSSVPRHKYPDAMKASQPLLRLRVIVRRPGLVTAIGSLRRMRRRLPVLGGNGEAFGSAAIGISIWPAAWVSRIGKYASTAARTNCPTLVPLLRAVWRRARRNSGGKRTEMVNCAGRTTTRFAKLKRSRAARIRLLTDLAFLSRTGSLKRSRNSTSTWTGNGEPSPRAERIVMAQRDSIRTPSSDGRAPLSPSGEKSTAGQDRFKAAAVRLKRVLSLVT